MIYFKNREQKSRLLLFLLPVLFIFLFSVTIVSATEFGYNNLNKPTLSKTIVNYTSVNVNDSDLWNGNAYDDEGHWETNGTAIWRTDGQVGIGTASPTHKLNVVGNINVTENISVEGYLEVDGNITMGQHLLIQKDTSEPSFTMSRNQNLARGSRFGRWDFKGLNGLVMSRIGIYNQDADDLSGQIKWALSNAGVLATKMTLDKDGNLDITGNLNVTGNVVIGGCLVVNGTTFGTCI